MRSSRLVAFVLALAITISSPALATEAGTALAQLKASHATAAKKLKADLKAARDVFLAELKAFEATVKAGGGNVALAQGLFDDLIALQVATGSAIEDAFTETTIAAKEALATLPPPLNGIYPRGFTVGDGGLVDRFRAQTDGTTEKHVATLRKRLVKTTTLADKAGVGLTFRLEVPVVTTEFQWSESSFAAGGGAPVAVDTIVTFSSLAVLGDGRVFLGGRAFLGVPLTVEFYGPTFFDFGGVPVVNQRWTTTASTDEGNYLVNVGYSVDAVTFPPITIGVR